jgi:hypothetical protein
MFKDSLNELNRKVDMMNQREAVFEKKFQNMEKHLTSLARTSNKVIIFFDVFLNTSKWN